MSQIETDYLVVGAGATGMAFVDTLIGESDADVVMVDRRYRPGGHWLDAYPFVRLHQPSACYGVPSRALGNDRIDDSGPNSGFYERSTAAEICSYYERVLAEDLLPSGRVRFLPMTDYRGADGDDHHVMSLVTGAETTIRVRRRLVDATYGQSSIPSRHKPEYDIDPGVRVIPPNDLVDLDAVPTGFTVLGAGKTAMDTCSWLLGQGVDPDRIRWIKPRDGWLTNRAFIQPLDQVGSVLQMQASYLESAAACSDARDFALRLEATGVFMRIDPTVEPEVFRGATLSLSELEELRSIENVVRHGRVRRIEASQINFDDCSVPTDTEQVYVDCTAEGLRTMVPRPIFEPGRITPQYVTAGIAPWSAATIAAVEALGRDDAHKNSLCPPLPMTGQISSMPAVMAANLAGTVARMSEPEVTTWNDRCRLNPARGAGEHMDDPRVPAAFTSIVSNMGPAMENLGRILS
ncbi:MAG TPA: NAD(P)/FAD-dependent oxidoreductase [Acidimicrobiales bacterium]|nr:NAD(P)/FAD-dependent oxidoreductase [Acidimicrobiales bacterium]